MLELMNHSGLPAPPGLSVAWDRHADEVRQAQRLRFDVFAGELGACIHTPLANHDVDRYDDFCEHLLVRHAASGEVVGTYRALTPTQARRAGSTYAEVEFDLAPLAPLRSRMLELGRSCVHPQHRHGGVILALWGAQLLALDAEPPPLIHGYLRLGARVLGPPAWDPHFNSADLPLLVRMADLPSRYRRSVALA